MAGDALWRRELPRCHTITATAAVMHTPPITMAHDEPTVPVVAALVAEMDVPAVTGSTSDSRRRWPAGVGDGGTNVGTDVSKYTAYVMKAVMGIELSAPV